MYELQKAAGAGLMDVQFIMEVVFLRSMVPPLLKTLLKNTLAHIFNAQGVLLRFQAAEQLIECRVLMYTYAFAYALEDGPRKKLFEFNQVSQLCTCIYGYG